LGGSVTKSSEIDTQRGWLVIAVEHKGQYTVTLVASTEGGASCLNEWAKRQMQFDLHLWM
jgi:hypothetical protein